MATPPSDWLTTILYQERECTARYEMKTSVEDQLHFESCIGLRGAPRVHINRQVDPVQKRTTYDSENDKRTGAKNSHRDPHQNRSNHHSTVSAMFNDNMTASAWLRMHSFTLLT